MSSDRYIRGKGSNDWSHKHFGHLTRYSTVTDDFNIIFNVLQSPRRRYVLYYLYSLEDEVTGFEEMVDAVSMYEAAGTETDKLPSQYEIRLTLHHTHIPHLEAAGIIDYDQRQRMIRFTGSSSLAEWVEYAQYQEFEEHP